MAKNTAIVQKDNPSPTSLTEKTTLSPRVNRYDGTQPNRPFRQSRWLQQLKYAALYCAELIIIPALVMFFTFVNSPITNSFDVVFGGIVTAIAVGTLEGILACTHNYTISATIAKALEYLVNRYFYTARYQHETRPLIIHQTTYITVPTLLRAELLSGHERETTEDDVTKNTATTAPQPAPQPQVDHEKTEEEQAEFILTRTSSSPI